MANIGGQAVIEGVLMRHENKVSIAIRKNKTIISKQKKINKKNFIARLFFIRGIVNMWEMLNLGLNALIWSADQQAPKNEKLSKTETTLTLLFSFLVAIIFFVAIPVIITNLIYKENNFLFNLIDGIVRILIFIFYIFLISKMKDIQRVFQYHGAEHKAVNCYESGLDLTIKNISQCSRIHTRCGTNFLTIVLLISILIFSLITSQHWYYKILLRIILIPVIIGISYEFLKLADKYKSNIIFNFLNKPGIFIQKITTQEPDKKQIEVAVYALKKVL
jgi:uncharacterized protein YqhQ